MMYLQPVDLRRSYDIAAHDAEWPSVLHSRNFASPVSPERNIAYLCSSCLQMIPKPAAQTLQVSYAPHMLKPPNARREQEIYDDPREALLEPLYICVRLFRLRRYATEEIRRGTVMQRFAQTYHANLRNAPLNDPEIQIPKQPITTQSPNPMLERRIYIKLRTSFLEVGFRLRRQFLWLRAFASRPPHKPRPPILVAVPTKVEQECDPTRTHYLDIDLDYIGYADIVHNVL